MNIGHETARDRGCDNIDYENGRDRFYENRLWNCKRKWFLTIANEHEHWNIIIH